MAAEVNQPKMTFLHRIGWLLTWLSPTKRINKE